MRRAVPRSRSSHPGIDWLSGQVFHLVHTHDAHTPTSCTSCRSYALTAAIYTLLPYWEVAMRVIGWKPLCSASCMSEPRHWDANLSSSPTAVARSHCETRFLTWHYCLAVAHMPLVLSNRTWQHEPLRLWNVGSRRQGAKVP